MKPSHVFAGTAAIVGLAMIAIGAPVPKPSPEQIRKELDPLWADLLSPNEQIAASATLKLAARKLEAVAYIGEQLRPLKLSKVSAKELIAKLSFGDRQEAEKAFDTLKYLDPRLAFNRDEIVELLKEDSATHRFSAVICGLPLDTFAKGEQDIRWHFYSPDGNRWRFNYGTAVKDHDTPISVAGIGTHDRKPTWVRAARAVAILEFVDSPKAREILEQLATGHPDAFPTKAAISAVERAKK